jgi:hypothetical protein
MPNFGRTRGRPRLSVGGERVGLLRFSGKASGQGAGNGGIHFSRPHDQVTGRLARRPKLLRRVGPTREKNRKVLMDGFTRHLNMQPLAGRPVIQRSNAVTAGHPSGPSDALLIRNSES